MKNKAYFYVKRIMDPILAFILWIVMAPVYLLLVLLIKLDSKGPVLFVQKRIGLHKKTFNVYKFRTMKIDTPANTPTHLLENPDQWLTRLGRFLRRSSLDEIPQLFNILKGQMSFVGPRPALWNQDDLIKERDIFNVHEVLPGITGWAQVYGRDALFIPEKARLDGEYITKFGFLTDLKIIVRTFFVVLRKDGIIEGGTGHLKDAEDKK